MLVKSQQAEDRIQHLSDTFQFLRKFNMKLNPEKCAFDVSSDTQITEVFQSWQIKRITSMPYHLVGNGQVESMNKVIINNLKKRLEESKGNWPKVLPGVFWAYRTTSKTSTGKTPFSLVYGAEALILVEIGEPSTRYTQATDESNEEEM
uniref:Uncharacterized protein LOC104233230 n=1 Tax=Nicotiana sylvestris TaxID=4096 RepID=A0A1U7X5C9_NICSY|nr:PREDICTED: uncharacterized protein LOC104233230 [Nicotiana sylvestris]